MKKLFTLLLFLAFPALGAQQIIQNQTGTTQTIQQAFGIVNANFSDLYGMVTFTGAITSGAWVRPPTSFRLLLSGTGTVTIDVQDSLQNLNTGIITYTLTGETQRIEFPALGTTAMLMRITLTGTAKASVL